MIGLLALTALTAAAPADAAIRWATPNGTASSTCPQTAPCSLEHAESVAQSSDDIRALPGTYKLNFPLVLDNVRLVGWNNGTLEPQPTILWPNGASFAVSVLNTTIENVRIQGTGTSNGVLRVTGSTVERVVAEGTGANTEAMLLRGNSQVDDSVAASTGQGDGTIQAIGADNVLERVTVVTPTAASPAIAAQGTTDPLLGDTTVELNGSILLSSPHLATDISASGPSAQAPATVTSDRTFLTTFDEGPNGDVTLTLPDSSQPLLVDPFDGDYRQHSNSPTVDAVGGPFGSFSRDYNGDLRSTVIADAGADELPTSAKAATGAVTGVTPTSAVLHGSASSGGSLTGYRLDWGPTTAYGGAPEPFRVLAPNVPSTGDFTRTLTGLQPGTTYHYRALAVNSRPEGGTAAGTDATFTTASLPAAPATSGATPRQPVVRLTAVGVSPSTFRVSRRPTTLRAAQRRRRKAKAPGGTVIRFALSRPAAVKLNVERKRTGRRKGKRCVAAKRPSKRLGKRALKPGRYRVSLVATDSAGRSKVRRPRFRVVG